jgi:hypothetical protein
MMARAHWIGVCCVILVFGFGCGKAEFKEFRCADGRFTVQMPGSPREQQDAIAGAVSKTYVLEVSNGAYTVSYADIPNTLGSPDGKLKELLDSAEKGLIKNVNAKLVRSSEVKLADKSVGREVKGELPPNGLILARIFIINRRMYYVAVSGTREWASSLDATKFLNSLVVE